MVFLLFFILGHDQLAATSIRFLAGVVGKQMHTGLFSDEATLRQIIEAIVIPNMSLRDSDVERARTAPEEDRGTRRFTLKFATRFCRVVRGQT